MIQVEIKRFFECMCNPYSNILFCVKWYFWNRIEITQIRACIAHELEHCAYALCIILVLLRCILYRSIQIEQINKFET